MSKNTNQLQKLKEEFEEHADNDWCHFEGDDDEVNVYFNDYPFYDDIWSFIQKVYTQAKEEGKKELISKGKPIFSKLNPNKVIAWEVPNDDLLSQNTKRK